MFLFASHVSDKSWPLLRCRLTLVFAITSLDLLVYAFLDFSLEDAGAGGLVVVGYLEDVRRVDPVVAAAAHDMVAIDVELIHTILSAYVRKATLGVDRRWAHGTLE